MLIGSGEDSSTVQRERIQRSAGRRLRPLILGVAILVLPVLVLVSMVTSRGDDPPGPDEATAGEFEVERSTDEMEREPADPEPGELQDYAVNGDDIIRDNRYSPVAAALDDVVITASFGSGARADVFAGPAGQLSKKFFDPATLTAFTLDASGAWVAGTYENSFGLDVLVVSPAFSIADPRRGSVGWAMTPIAVGTNGFAWHPTTPATLAYAENALTRSTTVTVRDFSSERPATQRFSVEFPGQLSVWGDWGFAFRQPGPLPFTSVATIPDELPPSGIHPLAILVEGVPGTAMGIIAPSRLLIDGAETASVLNLDSGLSEENVWFEPTERVNSFRESPDDRFSVGLLTERDSPISSGGWVVLFSADPESAVSPAERLFYVDGPTVFDWTASGRFVAGYQPTMLGPDGNRISAAAVTVYDLERALTVGRDIRIAAEGDEGPEGGSEPDLRLSIDSLAFSEPAPD